MSSNCQKITVRTVSHQHTTSDITDFVSGVSAITLDILDEYNTGVAASGEPLFISWANSYSAQLIDTYLTVNENSSVNWNYQGTDIKVLSSDWDNISNIVKTNSSLWILSGISVESDPIFTTWAQSYSAQFNNTTNTVNTNSANWESAYSTVNANSADWGNVSDNLEVNSFVNTNSSDIVLISNTVKTNSSLWILSGGSGSVPETDPIFSSWAQTYSGNYELAFNNLISNSAAYLTSTDLTLLAATSGNWNSVYTTVNENSAITWNYQGTDIKNLTAQWDTTYNTVMANSSLWEIDTDNSEVNSFVNTNSSDIILINTTVRNNSALWILSGGASVPEADPIFASWAQTYSGNYEIAFNNLISNSAAYLTSVDLSEVRSNSANWNSTYNTVLSNSAVVWNYQGTDLKLLSGDWDNIKTTVNNNSALWVVDTDNSEVNSFVNTNSASLLSVDTVVKNNSALWILSGISAETDPIFSSWAQSYSGVYNTVNSNSALWSNRGVDEIWIDAGAMAPQIGSPAQASTICLSSNFITFDCYDFDAGSSEYVHFKLSPPLNWNLGNFKTKFYWTSTTGTVGTSAVFSIQSMVKNDSEAIDQSWGTAVDVVDELITLSALHISNTSNTITFSGTPTQNSMIFFRIYRSVENASDNLATDARLLGMKLQFGTLSTVTIW